MNRNKRLVEDFKLLHKEVLKLTNDNLELMEIVRGDLNGSITKALQQDMDVEVKNELVRAQRDFLQKYTESHHQLMEMVKVSNAISEDLKNETI